MIKDHHYTCAHLACGCRVTPPSLYCTPTCCAQAERQEPRDETLGDAAPCACGHDACIARAAA